MHSYAPGRGRSPVKTACHRIFLSYCIFRPFPTIGRRLPPAEAPSRQSFSSLTLAHSAGLSAWNRLAGRIEIGSRDGFARADPCNR